MRSSASIGRYDLSCSQRPWLLACQRPSEGLQAGRRGGGGVKKNFPLRVAEVRAKLAPGTPVEVWFQDEMRVGQKNKLTYRWARVPAPFTINVPCRPTCSAQFALTA